MQTFTKRTILVAISASLLMTIGVSQAKDKQTIGVALPNLTNPYYVAMKKSFEKNGAAQGFEVRVLIADNDDAKQLSQIQSLIQQGSFVLHCC